MEQAAKPSEAPKPKSRTMLYAIIIIVLVVVGVGVYYLTRPPPSTPTSGPQVSIQDDNQCTSTNNDPACKFSPATIAAKANGTSVTWTITGGAPHSVHACVTSVLNTDGASQATACPSGLNSDSGDAFASVTLRSGGTTSYSHLFTHTGTYYYYCHIHTWMHGNVTVTA